MPKNELELFGALADFNDEQAARLMEKEREGYDGWDSMDETEIAESIVNKMNDPDENTAVDIANFLMFAKANGLDMSKIFDNMTLFI